MAGVAGHKVRAAALLAHYTRAYIYMREEKLYDDRNRRALSQVRNAQRRQPVVVDPPPYRKHATRTES